MYYVCKPEYVDLVKMFGLNIIPVPYHKSLAFHWRFRANKYDLVLDLHAKLASAIIKYSASCKVAVTYNKARCFRQAIVRGDKKKRIDSTMDLYYSALAKLGFREKLSYPQLIAHNSSLTTSPNVRIAIFPGATHFTKRYPAVSWVELINLLPQYSFTLLGGSADILAGREIAANTKGNCIDATGKHSISELVNELETYSLVISGDTGPMHIAAALSKPQIAIFGGTHPRLGFRPLNEKARILCADLHCQPCSLHGQANCPLQHFNCMNLITPSLIASEVTRILNLQSN